MTTEVADQDAIPLRRRRARGRIAVVFVAAVVTVLALAVWGLVKARAVAAAAPKIDAAREDCRLTSTNRGGRWPRPDRPATLVTQPMANPAEVSTSDCS